MRHWNLHEIETPDGTRSPVVVYSRDGEGRVVLIRLSPGQQLGDHGVHEAALLLVLDGAVHVAAGDESVDAGAGELFRFDPDERHSVTSDGGARVLLTLTPWPGDGHYLDAPADASGVSASS